MLLKPVALMLAFLLGLVALLFSHVLARRADVTESEKPT